MLVTVSNVKEYLEITEASYDTLLTSLCENISAFIEKEVQRDIEQTTHEEYFDGGEKLYLKNYPISSVSVYYNNGTAGTPNWVEYSDDDYVVYEDDGIVKHLASFVEGNKNIKVGYTGGYSTVPSDLEMLAKELVAKMFEQKHAQGKAVETVSNTTINWTALLSPEQRMILEKYRRLYV